MNDMHEQPKGLRTHIGHLRSPQRRQVLSAQCPDRTDRVHRVSYAGHDHGPGGKDHGTVAAGPVVFLDTAGVDDEGALGEQRRERTYRAVDRTDVALLVTDGQWGDFERKLAELFRERKIPFIAVMSRADTVTPAPSVLKELEEAGIPVVRVSALRAEGLEELRDAIARTVLEKSEQDRKLVGDVVPAGQSRSACRPH